MVPYHVRISAVMIRKKVHCYGIMYIQVKWAARFCHTHEQVVASDSNALFSKIIGFVLFVTLNNRNLNFLANI